MIENRPVQFENTPLPSAEYRKLSTDERNAYLKFVEQKDPESRLNNISESIVRRANKRLPALVKAHRVPLTEEERKHHRIESRIKWRNGIKQLRERLTLELKKEQVKNANQFIDFKRQLDTYKDSINKDALFKIELNKWLRDLSKCNLMFFYTGLNMICHKCSYGWDTKSHRYRVSCPNCGAWVINENATYKPTR
jgi:rubrerythrin